MAISVLSATRHSSKFPIPFDQCCARRAFPVLQIGDVRVTYLEKRRHLALCQIGSLSPPFHLSRRWNDSRATVRAMRQCEGVVGLHAATLQGFDERLQSFLLIVRQWNR